MGASVHFIENQGPKLNPIRDQKMIDALHIPDKELDYVMQTIRLVKQELKNIE